MNPSSQFCLSNWKTPCGKHLEKSVMVKVWAAGMTTKGKITQSQCLKIQFLVYSSNAKITLYLTLPTDKCLLRNRENTIFKTSSETYFSLKRQIRDTVNWIFSSKCWFTTSTFPGCFLAQWEAGAAKHNPTPRTKPRAARKQSGEPSRSCSRTFQVRPGFCSWKSDRKGVSSAPLRHLPLRKHYLQWKKVIVPFSLKSCLIPC